MENPLSKIQEVIQPILDIEKNTQTVTVLPYALVYSIIYLVSNHIMMGIWYVKIGGLLSNIAFLNTTLLHIIFTCCYLLPILLMSCIAAALSLLSFLKMNHRLMNAIEYAKLKNASFYLIAVYAVMFMVWRLNADPSRHLWIVVVMSLVTVIGLTVFKYIIEYTYDLVFLRISLNKEKSG